MYIWVVLDIQIPHSIPRKSWRANLEMLALTPFLPIYIYTHQILRNSPTKNCFMFHGLNQILPLFQTQRLDTSRICWEGGSQLLWSNERCRWFRMLMEASKKTSDSSRFDWRKYQVCCTQQHPAQHGVQGYTQAPHAPLLEISQKGIRHGGQPFPPSPYIHGFRGGSRCFWKFTDSFLLVNYTWSQLKAGYWPSQTQPQTRNIDSIVYIIRSCQFKKIMWC